MYLDTLLRETDALRQALTFSDDKIQTMPLVLRGMKYSVVVIAEVIAGICQHGSGFVGAASSRDLGALPAFVAAGSRSYKTAPTLLPAYSR